MNAPFLLLTASFGALALVSQVVIMRQLMVAFYGTEMIVALVLAAWLAGVFLGARCAGLIRPEKRDLRRWLLVVPACWAALLLTIITLSFFIPGLIGLAPGEVAPFNRILLWVFILAAPASFFTGALFVLAGSFLHQLLTNNHENEPNVGGTVFWVESLGSCLGLIAYTYLMAGKIGPVQTMLFFIGLVLFFQAASLPRLWSTRAIASTAVIGLSLLVHLTGAAAGADLAAEKFRFKLSHPAYNLLDVKDTPYQHLALAERGGEKALFGNQSFIGSWPDPYTYQRLSLLFLTESHSYNKVLLAGQGPGGFIHELLNYGVKKLVYVSLDPAETMLIASGLPAEKASDLKDERLQIIHDDLRHFLKTTDETGFDLVIINAPDPENAQINRMYTWEFFNSARRIMSPNAVITTSISGADNYWSRELLSFGHSLYFTIRDVFKYVTITPGDRHYFFASNAPGIITDDPKILARRYRQRGFSSPYMTPRSFTYFFPPTGTEYIRQRLAQQPSTSINTDAEPLSYFLRLIWWEKLTGQSWTKALLSKAQNIKQWGPVAGLIAILPMLFIAVRPAPARSAVWVMAMTGAVTMAMHIILIFIFQNNYGILYKQIGFITALFMAGLASGGLCGRFFSNNKALSFRILPFLEASLCLAAVLIAFLAEGRLSFNIYYVVFAAGFFSGLEFSLLFVIYMQDRKNPDIIRALTRLEAADHGGAVVGALLTGLVLAPVLGLVKTAYILAALKGIGALAVLRLGKST